jgi:hypothetical protein
MNPTMTFSETLTVTSCWCGVNLAIPANLYRYARNHSNYSIYCPLGHTFFYRNSFEDELKRERRQHEATRELLHAEERSHVATRGHLTRARRRAAAGVCPCCHRSFENVARHVKTKHPDFDPAAGP